MSFTGYVLYNLLWHFTVQHNNVMPEIKEQINNFIHGDLETGME